MPKLSVYVQDELWNQAKSLPVPEGGKPNNSQIVQRALEQLVREQEARQAAFAVGAVRDTARVAAIVEQLREEARHEYERGYSAGLELAEALGFDELRMQINAGGLRGESGIVWLASVADESGAEPWWKKHGAAFSEYSPYDETLLDRSEAFCAGAAQALEDVWAALRANAWGTNEPTGDVQSEQEGHNAAAAEDDDD